MAAAITEEIERRRLFTEAADAARAFYRTAQFLKR